MWLTERALGAKLQVQWWWHISALTLEPERTKQALKEAGAEEFIELDLQAEGVTIEHIDNTLMNP